MENPDINPTKSTIHSAVAEAASQSISAFASTELLCVPNQ
jgi:hypothetical protein